MCHNERVGKTIYKKMKKIVICSPTYNEVGNIEILCTEIFKVNKNFHVLIIDDNSTDGTLELIKKLKFKFKNLNLIKRKKKLGIGSAYRVAFDYAFEKKHDALITLDAELSHNPKEIPLLLKKLKSNDFVTGSRYIKGGKSDYKGYRDFISRFANKLCRFLLNMPFFEFTTSFRIYNYKCIELLRNKNLDSDGYSSLVEFFFYIYKSGFKCSEVPIYFRVRHKGDSKIPKLQVFYSSMKLIELFIKNLLIQKRK